MSKFIKILFLITFGASTVAQSQDMPVACAGGIVRYGITGQPGSDYNWNVEGGEIIRNYNDSVDIQWSTKAGVFSISVNEITYDNCIVDPAFASVQVNAPEFEFEDDEIDICEGDEVDFVSEARFKSYTWNNEDGDNITSIETSGMVTMSYTDNDGCIAIDSMWVNVNPLPYVELGNDTTLCGTNILVLDGGYDALNYKWSTNETSQTILVEEGANTYTVTVESEKGCFNYDTIQVFACLELEEFKKGIPTAFTPNGDGDNDVWEIPGIESYPDADVEIFDRWGRSIFTIKNGYTEKWDGTLKGNVLPMDSYYYVIDLKSGMGSISGSVAIIK